MAERNTTLPSLRKQNWKNVKLESEKQIQFYNISQKKTSPNWTS